MTSTSDNIGSIIQSMKRNNNSGNQPYHRASLRTSLWTHSRNYGARASLNVYGLQLTRGQESLLSIQAASGLYNDFNIIQAGWNVCPDYYGDNDTHFFVSWSTKSATTGFKRGCDNLDCKGFILNNASKLVPGNRLKPLSKYNGTQYFITLKLFKDHVSGDWWLHSGPNDVDRVGYWPKSLITSLANYAELIDVGGYAISKSYITSPPMGSGHDAREGEAKAASIKHPRLINENASLLIPNKHTFEYSYVYNNKKCNYRITGDYMKGTVYVGGPGGC